MRTTNLDSVQKCHDILPNFVILQLSWHRKNLNLTEGAFPTVGDVKKTIAIRLLLVDLGHKCGGGGQGVVDEDENGFLWLQFDALADDVDKLADCQIRRHQVFFLVDVRDIAVGRLFADDRDAVRVLEANSGRLRFPLVECVLSLEI